MNPFYQNGFNFSSHVGPSPNTSTDNNGWDRNNDLFNINFDNFTLNDDALEFALGRSVFSPLPLESSSTTSASSTSSLLNTSSESVAPVAGTSTKFACDYQLGKTGRILMSIIYTELEQLKVERLNYEKVLCEFVEEKRKLFSLNDAASSRIQPQEQTFSSDFNIKSVQFDFLAQQQNPRLVFQDQTLEVNDKPFFGITSYDFNPADLTVMAEEADRQLKKFITVSKIIFDQMHEFLVPARFKNQLAYKTLRLNDIDHLSNAARDKSTEEYWDSMKFLKLCYGVFDFETLELKVVDFDNYDDYKMVKGEGEEEANSSKASIMPFPMPKPTGSPLTTDSSLTTLMAYVVSRAKVSKPADEVQTSIDKNNSLLKKMNTLIMRWVSDNENVRKYVSPYLKSTSFNGANLSLTNVDNQNSAMMPASNTLNLVPFYLESMGDAIKNGRRSLSIIFRRLQAMRGIGYPFSEEVSREDHAYIFDLPRPWLLSAEKEQKTAARLGKKMYPSQNQPLQVFNLNGILFHTRKTAEELGLSSYCTSQKLPATPVPQKAPSTVLRDINKINSSPQQMSTAQKYFAQKRATVTSKDYLENLDRPQQPDLHLYNRGSVGSPKNRYYKKPTGKVIGGGAEGGGYVGKRRQGISVSAFLANQQ